MLERSSAVQDGMGISIDTSLLASVTGADVWALPVVQTGFPATGWMQLWSLLADIHVATSDDRRGVCPTLLTRTYPNSLSRRG